MLKDMDFGVYGKGVDGYVHYSLAMDRIREEEENRKALMDEFDNDEDNSDSDDLDSDDFGSDDFGRRSPATAAASCRLRPTSPRWLSPARP